MAPSGVFPAGPCLFRLFKRVILGGHGSRKTINVHLIDLKFNPLNTHVIVIFFKSDVRLTAKNDRSRIIYK